MPVRHPREMFKKQLAIRVWRWRVGVLTTSVWQVENIKGVSVTRQGLSTKPWGQVGWSQLGHTHRSAYELTLPVAECYSNYAFWNGVGENHRMGLETHWTHWEPDLS